MPRRAASAAPVVRRRFMIDTPLIDKTIRSRWRRVIWVSIINLRYAFANMSHERAYSAVTNCRVARSFGRKLNRLLHVLSAGGTQPYSSLRARCSSSSIICRSALSTCSSVAPAASRWRCSISARRVSRVSSPSATRLSPPKGSVSARRRLVCFGEGTPPRSQHQENLATFVADCRPSQTLALGGAFPVIGRRGPCAIRSHCCPRRPG